MKKASIPVIILIIAVTASLAILSIKIFESADSFFQSVNKNGDKPEVTYNYSLLRDEMSKVSFDIYMQVEAPTGGYGTGFLKKPKYWATLCLSAEEGENVLFLSMREATKNFCIC